MRIRLLIVFLLVGFIGNSQIRYLHPWYHFENKVTVNDLFADSVFYAPLIDTGTHTPTRLGAITIHSVDSSAYIWNGYGWQILAGAADGNNYPSSMSFSGGILTVPRNGLSDLTATIDGRYLKISDTSGIWLTETTANGLYAEIDHSHIASDVSDLTSYVRNLFSGGTGITYNDSTGVISWNGSASGITDLNGLTSTTQTFSGVGISINSTGTDHEFTVDSLLYTTRLRSQHLIDSLNAVIQTALGLKLNISDTAGMLDTYVQRQELIDTAAAIRADIGSGGGSGETNTASNLGGGLANYDSKSGVDLRFNSFNSTDFDLASNVISIDATLKSTWDAKISQAQLDDTAAAIRADFPSGGGSGWGLTGNAGTTAGTNFLGTTDAQDVVFKRNSSEVLRLKSGKAMVGGGSEVSSTFEFEIYAASNPNMTLSNGTQYTNILTGGSLSIFQFPSSTKFGIQAATSVTDGGTGGSYPLIAFGSANNHSVLIGGVAFNATPNARLDVRGDAEFTDKLTMAEIAAPSTPASGKAVIYPKTNGLWYGKDDAGTEKKLSNPTLTKSIVLESPTASESISFGGWRTPVAITVSAVQAIVEGSSPSVTYNIAFGTDITSLTNVFTAGQTVTSTTTGTTASGFNDATIPAGSWIKLTTSAASGTITSLAVSITFTED